MPSVCLQRGAANAKAHVVGGRARRSGQRSDASAQWAQVGRVGEPAEGTTAPSSQAASPLGDSPTSVWVAACADGGAALSERCVSPHPSIRGGPPVVCTQPPPTASATRSPPLQMRVCKRRGRYFALAKRRVRVRVREGGGRRRRPYAGGAASRQAVRRARATSGNQETNRPARRTLCRGRYCTEREGGARLVTARGRRYSQGLGGTLRAHYPTLGASPVRLSFTDRYDFLYRLPGGIPVYRYRIGISVS